MATAVSTVPPSPLVLTYEDLQGMPEDGRRYEILHGELHVTPAPSTTHQRISRNLEFALHTTSKPTASVRSSTRRST
jgi:Uma2 family endonuclease